MEDLEEKAKGGTEDPVNDAKPGADVDKTAESKKEKTGEEPVLPTQDSKNVKNQTDGAEQVSRRSNDEDKKDMKTSHVESDRRPENASSRKRKFDSVKDDGKSDAIKVKKVVGTGDKAAKPDNSRGDRNSANFERGKLNDDPRGRAPQGNNNNRSQRERRAPEARQQNNPPQQRRGSDRGGRGGENQKQSPPRQRRETRESHTGGQGTHTRFLSPDGRDLRGDRRGAAPESRRQGGGGPRQFNDRRNADTGGRGGRGYDDRRGARDGGGSRGGENPDRRNDSGRSAGNRRRGRR